MPVRDELKQLIDDVRNGMSETVSTEFKRSWWDFRHQSDEYARDVAALANANTKDEKMIVVGLAEKGRIYDAPPPEDEAQLQNRLSDKITPLPNVRLETAQVEGSTLSVLRVLPPFDKPYVTLFNNKNTIFVRRGSRVSTATRAMLDEWRAETQGAVDLRFIVGDAPVAHGTAIEYPRARHEPDPKWSAGGLSRFAAPSHTNPVEEANALNRALQFGSSIGNFGDAPARDLLVDVELTGPINASVTTSWNHKQVGSPWQMDPAHNAYVESCRPTASGWAIRQRVRLVHPGVSEHLIPVNLTCELAEDGTPKPVGLKYRVVDSGGERLAGSLFLKPVFTTETKIVESRFQPAFI